MSAAKTEVPDSFIALQVLQSVLVPKLPDKVEGCSHPLPKTHHVAIWDLCEICYVDYLDMMRKWVATR